MQTESLSSHQNRKKLCIIMHGFNNGGEEKVLYTYLSNLNINCIDIDIVSFEKQSDRCFEAFKKLSNKIYFVTPKKKNFLKYIKEVKKIIKNGNYDIVHSNLEERNSIPLFYAKKYNVGIRISHCHIAKKNTILEKIIKKINSIIIKSVATNLIGCSSVACQYLYGKTPAEVLPNSINFQDYFYHLEDKNVFRNSLNLKSETIIIGNVARLSFQKNHKKMIEIAEIIKKRELNFCFVCVGCGELEYSLKNEINDKGLNDYFKIVGESSNVSTYYSLFDLFCFPSLFEGLGMSFVEAEISGLPCVISNTVPNEAIISNRVMVKNLNDSAESWLDDLVLLYFKYKNSDRMITSNYLMSNSEFYKINANILKLKKLYGLE